MPSTRLARRAELHTSASTQRLERQIALGSLRPDRAQRDSRIVAINLLRNYGQHNANLAGLRETTGDYVITMDDDGQNPADQVPLLIAEAMTGRDVVFGDYELKQAHGIRRLGSKLINVVNRRVFGQPNHLEVSNFRILRRDVVDRICASQTAHPYITGQALHYSANRGVRLRNRELDPPILPRRRKGPRSAVAASGVRAQRLGSGAGFRRWGAYRGWPSSSCAHGACGLSCPWCPPQRSQRPRSRRGSSSIVANHPGSRRTGRNRVLRRSVGAGDLHGDLADPDEHLVAQLGRRLL